jgi:hypothetical protein
MTIIYFKLRLCFNKYKKYGINMNLVKKIMVYFGMILRFIVSKKEKILEIQRKHKPQLACL